MSKQDVTYSRTAEDLERKYNLGQIAQGGTGGDSGKISQVLQELSNCKVTISSMLRKINEIESEIEGGIGGDIDIDYSKLEFDTEEIVVKDPVDKILSHVGMVVHSTTLDTMEKVVEIYGGKTWVKIEGRFLLGQSSSYAVNSVGGEATHTLSVNEMPRHTHYVGIGDNFNILYWGNGKQNNTMNYWGIGYQDSGVPAGNTIIAGSTGGSQPHNNMPPYKTVYIWERTE